MKIKPRTRKWKLETVSYDDIIKVVTIYSRYK